jgi:hypothetical protein
LLSQSRNPSVPTIVPPSHRRRASLEKTTILDKDDPLNSYIFQTLVMVIGREFDFLDLVGTNY